MRERWGWAAAIAAATVLGGLLRLHAAGGALWLDEAWSALLARDAGTPIGVLIGINHDNNHHLNSLWLQWVGFGAPPVVQRALSIVSGTAMIAVTAAIGWRRTPAAGAVAAALFAVAPALVTYGSEARGYAPMLLALAIIVALVDRWLERPDRPPPAVGIAVAALLGTLAQGTMLFGLAAVGAWAVGVRWRQAGPRAVREVAAAFLPAIVTVAALLALFAWSAQRSSAGFQVGAVEPHRWDAWAAGIGTAFAFVAGPAGVLALVAPRRDRLAGLALAAAAVPVALALFSVPNSGQPRYHLFAAVPILLWASVALVHQWQAGGGWRVVAIAAAATMLFSAATRDATLLANRRGDPGAAIDWLRAAAPGGSAVAIAHPRSEATLLAAAAAHRYPLRIATDCPPAPFRFVERDGEARFPAAIVACDARYLPVIGRRAIGLSGTHWRLYRRADPPGQNATLAPSENTRPSA